MIAAVMPTYARTDFAISHGEGSHVWTDAGRRLLDLGSGIAVSSLGHAHPKLVKAISDQAGKLLHCSNLYQISAQTHAADTLVANSFADSVFFTNSGAEALECAFKMARRYHHANGHPEKYRIIACEGSFHGRTLATISASGNPKYTDGFGPKTEGFDQVPFGNLNAMRAAVTPETAAILVEPVQGEGGIRPAPEGYLKGLRDICDEFGLLLVLDEVQCGNGRTGKLYAHEWAGITPDIMATAKGLGGGFPVGACLATEAACAAMTAGTHGTTYGGNPLAMAACGVVLEELLSDGFLNDVQEVAHTLGSTLEEVAKRHPRVIEEVRGQGLMLGLKCSEALNMDLVKALMDAGALTVPAAENVVRILPPLVLTEADAIEAGDILEAACTTLEETMNKGAA